MQKSPEDPSKIALKEFVEAVKNLGMFSDITKVEVVFSKGEFNIKIELAEFKIEGGKHARTA